MNGIEISMMILLRGQQLQDLFKQQQAEKNMEYAIGTFVQAHLRKPKKHKILDTQLFLPGYLKWLEWPCYCEAWLCEWLIYFINVGFEQCLTENKFSFIKMAEQINAALASSHDYIEITTKLH